MSLNLTIPQTDDQLKPRITVIGVGGAGGNAVNNMIHSNLEGVEFLVTNTDAQALSQSPCQRKIQLGRNLTRGLGAGARPDVGRAAAEEAMDEILSCLDGCNMVFITAGMGGGTGTGAAPVIARAAREQGILTVGVITKPFHFEGVHRMRLAEAGINELTQHVDTLIIIPNQNLFRVANEKTTFADAFKMADDVLESGVRGVTDLMVLPGLINLDFNDIRTVMTEMGKAMMGTGEAEGENRAVLAAEAAIANPLLDDVSMRGARGVLINITGGPDLTLFEVDEAANKIREQVDPEANIIFGSCLDEKLEGKLRISIVATGIDVQAAKGDRPMAPSLSLIASERERRRVQPAPAPQPAAAVAAAAAMVQPQPVAHGALRSQAVTMTATAQVLEPQQMTAPMAQPQALALELPTADMVEEDETQVLEVLEEEPTAEATPAPAPSFVAPQQDHVEQSCAERGIPVRGYFTQDYVETAVRTEPEPEPAGEVEAEAEIDPQSFAEPFAEQPEDADVFAARVEEGRQSFVAPAPVMTEAEPVMPAAPAQRPDPFREAELANASHRPEPAPRGRGPSLISKVTGLGRLLGGVPAPTERRVEPAMQPQQPAATVQRAAATVRQPAPQQAAYQAPSQPQPQPAMPPLPRTAASQARTVEARTVEPRPVEPRPVPAQPRLNLDPVDRRTSMADEHLLDIPAFLRRQAN
jgi:cell division protein FtsZ